ncbi:hypothetical protein GYB22_06750 [bacterium]|nr:hypothetical protein [bacterium]
MDVDSTEIVKVAKFGDFSFTNLSHNVFSLRCTDIAFAPDTHDLYAFFRQSVQFADSLNDDTLTVVKSQIIDFDKGFKGVAFHFKVVKPERTYHHIKVTAYSYGEMFGDFIFHHFSDDSINLLSDSNLLASMFEGYLVYSMEEIRKENLEIRNKYTLEVESLPFDNYWIQIGRENGKMVRDTIYMADIDSVQYKPRLTSYNITYKGRLNISPEIEHEIVGLEMENLKSLEFKDNGYVFEVRDLDRGTVKKFGTVTLLNSIGYPIELRFYYNYRNTLLEMLD